MLNKLEVVREFVNEGYRVPIDLAVSLWGDGYDISSFENNFDGFTIEDFIDMKEMYDY